MLEMKLAKSAPVIVAISSTRGDVNFFSGATLDLVVTREH